MRGPRPANYCTESDDRMSGLRGSYSHEGPIIPRESTDGPVISYDRG